MINLTIDNKPIQVPEGTTILKAARMNGIDIPTLCHFELDGMNFENKPGGCRVCVVEVKGRRNLAPACATDVMEGMEVLTHSARVINARKTVVELILSDHPNDCLQCEKNVPLTVRTAPSAFTAIWTSASCAAAASRCATSSCLLVP